MRTALRSIFQHRGLSTLVALLFASGVFATESTNQVAVTNDAAAEAALRAYLQLQEKVHATGLAIEQSRQEATAALQRNGELFSARLKLIEQALSLQREREAESVQKANRLTIITAGTFGGLGLLAMLLTAFFLVRTMGRLTDLSAAIPKALGGGGSQMGNILGISGGGVMALPPESSRLLNAIERLEARIHQLEGGPAAAPQLLTMSKEKSNGNGHHPEIILDGVSPTEPITVDDPQERVSVMLGKGQTLLNLGQSENALKCFEEVLSIDPENAESLVKKGTALERLRRWEEALQCYDRAIATNSELTLAYLYKGGVFNQLERFSEALECYEQALRTQQKAASPA